MNNGYDSQNENNSSAQNPNGEWRGDASSSGDYSPYGSTGGPYGPNGQGAYTGGPYNYNGAPVYTDESGLFNENRMARKNGTSATIRLSDWMKADCLMFLNLIPCIGSAAAIILYCVLAFSSKTAVSLKTRYQANLIWSAIVLVLYLVIIIMAVVLGVALGGLLDSQT